jgi:hypothetical protein
MADSTDEEVEAFLSRISGRLESPEIEIGEQTTIDEENRIGENKDVLHTSHKASEQILAESGCSPLPEKLADHDGPTPNRRYVCLDSDDVPLVVHRPIPFNTTSISFDAGEQRYRLEVHDLDWYTRLLERYADAGYGPRSKSIGNVANIVDILYSLPPDLADIMKEGLHALHVLQAAHTTSRRPIAAAATASESFGSFAAMEDDMWEHGNQCGYLRFEWDPVTERRRYSSPPLPPARTPGMTDE